MRGKGANFYLRQGTAGVGHVVDQNGDLVHDVTD